MQILVLNAGSSSLKYKLFDMSGPLELAKGQVERIGTGNTLVTHHWDLQSPIPMHATEERTVDDQHGALERIVTHLETQGLVRDAGDIGAIGHRVVHGGEHFNRPALIDETVIAAIRSVVPLAPLHNPANLEGIDVARRRWPGLPQVAVFDTAFHQSMPPQAYRYALPSELYEAHGVRRYGFHGSSHRYVSRTAAQFLERPLDQLNLISLHLGNGCSAAAIRHGRSVDTSMGMTPLQGLVMGTRSGDIDPAIPFFLRRETGLSCEQIEDLLVKHSGLAGICGLSDMRAINDSDSDRARLAEQMFAYSAKKYIGAYHAVLGRVDALVFTGGIGENAAAIRQSICEGLEGFGLCLDPAANIAATQGCRRISGDKAPTPILVIPTDEELEIAQGTLEVVSAGGSR